MFTKPTSLQVAIGACMIASSIAVLIAAGTYFSVQQLLSRQTYVETQLSQMNTQNTVTMPPDPCMMTDVPGRAWGPEQATGQPNTKCMGDYGSAWASLTTDDQDEWLLLTYPEPIKTNQISVYESFNPGALSKITAVDGKKETVLWEGNDPAVAVNDGVAVATIELKSPVTTKQIKLYLNSKAASGWNEIDAVGLGLADGGESLIWATEAKASSTYAEQPSDTLVQPRL